MNKAPGHGVQIGEIAIQNTFFYYVSNLFLYDKRARETSYFFNSQ